MIFLTYIYCYISIFQLCQSSHIFIALFFLLAILSFIMLLPSCLHLRVFCVIHSTLQGVGAHGKVSRLTWAWPTWIPVAQHPYPFTQLCHNPLSFQIYLITLYFLSDESSNICSACCSLTIYKLPWTLCRVLDIWALCQLWIETWGCEGKNDVWALNLMMHECVLRGHLVFTWQAAGFVGLETV